jgi:hypothetical protein
MSLEIVPLTLKEANAFVREHHRHHGELPGCKFCIGVAEGGKIVGAAIVGRPIARQFDDSWTLEVNRTCTNGTRNANSMLYGAAWRAAKALGYRRLVTYTRIDESGVSLRAAGWRVVAQRKARSWAKEYYRPRVDKTEPYQRLLWEMTV